MIVNFKFENPAVKLPVRASKHASAYDVFVDKIEREADDLVVVRLGWAAEFPVDHTLKVVPRSSITKTKWVIQNSPGIGDPDFRGFYSLRFRAFPESVKLVDFPEHDARKFKLTYPQFPYKVGERCAQIYFTQNVEVEFKVKEDLSDTERGVGAFGSTGK